MIENKSIPRIRTVQIENYKSLASVSVDLEPFTVCVGPNASGKSNFVDALGFTQECMMGPVEVALNKRGGIREVISRSERRATINLPSPPAPTEQI